MPRYRCRGIDVEVRIDVEVPMSRYKYRDADGTQVPYTAIEVRKDVEIPIASAGLRPASAWYRCRGIDVDVPARC